MAVNLSLYEVLKNLGVSAEQASLAAEQEPNIGKIEERLRSTDERLRSVEVQLAVLKWITGTTGAGVLIVIGMVWNVMTRLPS